MTAAATGEWPNMPKHQPCPNCSTPSKRTSKTVGGANYYCRRCKDTFFVSASERGKGYQVGVSA